MKYNATLNRKYQTAPAVALLELDIPEKLDDESRVRFAAHELLKLFDVHIDPIKGGEGELAT